jgi:hypothetical protein
MSILSSQSLAAAIYQAILGNKADTTTLNFFGYQVVSGKLKPEQMANNLVATHDGQTRFQGLGNNEKINYIYNNITGMQPDTATLTTLVAKLEQGVSLGDIALNIINQLESYSGNDETTLTQQTFLANNIATTLYPALNHPTELGASAADVQAIYHITGGAVVAEGVNFWANYLHNNPEKLAYVAQKFVEGRPAIASLSNENFIRTLFQNTFKQPATQEEVAHYLAGLENDSETRGDVVAKMLNDIRTDTTHPEAKAQFDLVSHVYAAGEMPAATYQETVASFYFTIANIGVSADALDSWSKKLASGTSEAELLKMLSASAQFKTAGNYGEIYQKLYGETLTATESQAILLKAGNNKYQATSLIIEAFRNGEYPLDNHSTPPSPGLLINYEQKIGLMLNYATGPATLEVSANGGNPSGIVNSGNMHQLSNAELLQITKIALIANADQAADLSFSKVSQITLSGEFATSNTVINSINKYAKDITLLLDSDNLHPLGSNVNLGNGNIVGIVNDDADVAHANIQLTFSSNSIKSVQQGLYWNGNGQNNGANQVSNTFTAKSSDSSYTTSTLSANFITKNIYLTTQQDGSVNGVIKSSYDQFFGFKYIDLTHYKGTGNIYLDGALIATEGVNVLDFGVSTQKATINNTQYTNVGSLTQAAVSAGNYTGQSGLTISAYSGEIHVLNLSPGQYDYSPYSLTFNGDVTSDSKVYLNYMPNNAVQTELQGFGIRLADVGLQKLNAGTVDISAEGNYTGALIIVAEGRQTEKNLTLSGANNHIQRIELDGTNANILNLTISHDFSDSLKTISAIPYADHRAADIILNLNAEKGGTGGGSFFNTLSGLADTSSLSAITAQLAGDQLSVGNNGFSNASVTINHATVQGNTTLEKATELNFADSSIDSLVSLSKLSTQTQIHVGTDNQQWTFSANGNKTMQVYGSVTKPADVNALFNGINMNGVDSVSTLFGKVLSQVTLGTSEGQLAEAGLIKLDHTLYVIIDKNHNQSFDDQDIVFALGNQQSELDVYQTAVSLHYLSPEASLVGSSPAPSEAFA